MIAISAEASGRGESLTSSTPFNRTCQARVSGPSVRPAAISPARRRSISLIVTS